MEQLIRMRTIPLSFEFKVHPARLELKTEPASYSVKRDRGAFEINSTPARFYIDSRAMRASTGWFPNITMFNKYIAQKGVKAAFEEVGRLVKEGNRLADIYKHDNPIAQIARESTDTRVETVLGFSPSEPLNIKWDPHNLSIRYEMDRLFFEWRTNQKPELEFIPAKIEFVIKEYARLEVEYIGGPIYIPPSADPSYEPKHFSSVA